MSVKKGDTIGTFLKAVRDQLGSTFKELRGVSVDNLMYIKVLLKELSTIGLI